MEVAKMISENVANKFLSQNLKNSKTNIKFTAPYARHIVTRYHTGTLCSNSRATRAARKN